MIADRREYTIRRDAEVPGDWVRVFAQDDAVVFRIEVREEPPSSGGVR